MGSRGKTEEGGHEAPSVAGILTVIDTFVSLPQDPAAVFRLVAMSRKEPPMGVRVVALVSLVLFAFGCSSPTSSSGFDSSGLNQFRWTDDGRSFQTSSDAMGASRGNTAIDIFLIDCNGTLLQIRLGDSNPSTRTYPIGDTAPLFTVEYVADGLSWFGSSFFGGTAAVFGSGSLTISTVDSVRISGNFNFELLPNTSFDAVFIKSVQGTFDVPFLGPLGPRC